MKNKWVLAAVLILTASAAVFLFFKHPWKGRSGPPPKFVTVERGSIRKFVTATATVQPQNRLEMKAPVGGRIDQILVQEGQNVKTGDVLAVMSSTERAALIDAARSQSPEELKYWEDVYKTIQIVSPIDGEVIVKSTQPGQTVTPTDDVIVLSDRLIVEAQIDETDIGRVKEGQAAKITLDAYPDIEVEAKVGHIYYESQIVNNVTTYKVDILPDSVPAVFRSGMSANIQILQVSKENILTVPIEAVKHGKDGNDFVLVSRGKNEKLEKRPVETGISDDATIEIVSGVEENDTLVIPPPKQAGAKPQNKGGGNPFAPSFGGRKK